MSVRLDSQCEVANLRFHWQGQHFQGFADFAEKRKIDQHRRKITPTMLRERAARRKLDFPAPGCDLASILVTSAHSPALQGTLSGVPGRSWEFFNQSRGAPGALREASTTLPGQLRAAPGTDLGSIFVPIFASISQASWPANDIPLDCQAHKRAGPRASHNDPIGQKKIDQPIDMESISLSTQQASLMLRRSCLLYTSPSPRDRG